LVEDVHEGDPTCWRPGWVQAEGFRGHALVPLLVEDRSIGVLVLDQRKPGLLQPEDLRFLQLMANQAAIAIEKARLHEEEVKVQALERELDVGRRIQLSLLPEAPPSVEGWELVAFYQPARVVGGDFYDFLEFSDAPDRLGLTIADVTGKGVPAALFMARSSSILRTVALSGLGPCEVLTKANELILRDGQTELYVTAFYALLDTATGHLAYATAGHDRPLRVQAATGQIRELNAVGIVMGAFPTIELEQGEIDLAPGDVLVLYTDGVTEAMDRNHNLFGIRRLEATLAANHGASAQAIVAAVVDAVRAYAGDVPPSDDLTLVVVRRAPLTP
jgi:sigma-B regulation protein RsbU (phosphoserine phosphatase)